MREVHAAQLEKIPTPQIVLDRSALHNRPKWTPTTRSQNVATTR